MDYTKELEKLHDLKEKNIISEDDYNEQKEVILSKMKTPDKPKEPEAQKKEASTTNVGFDPTAKSKMTAGLLGIFLGSLGIHRFYLGYTGIGVAQICVTLFTCGFGSLWGFIEGILILAGSSITTDASGKPLVE
tara:strand:+ start:73 stop:474 length:402 start_codon:yes stop_codon:yes gene_type:complete